MKFGCSAQVSELSAVHALGFDYVELRGRELAALTPVQLDFVAAELERLHLPCLALNAYCPPDVVIAGPGFDLSRARSYAEALALRASRLGVLSVGIGSPGSRRLPVDFNRETAWDQARAFTAGTAELFARFGIRVGFEALGPCYCNFINRVQEASRMAEQLSGVGLTLDFYNMEQSGEADCPLLPYAHQILHVHISDDLGSPQQRSFLRPEKHALHRSRIKRLAEAGYDGTLSLEVDVPVGPEAARSLAFLRELSSNISKGQ